MSYDMSMAEINWKNYFDRNILEQGKVLQKIDNVANFTYLEINDSITGMVFDDTRYYSTSIAKSKMKEGLFFRCSCNQGKKGELCEHEAALCFEADKRCPAFFGGKAPLSTFKKDINPFSYYDDDDYYFPISDIFAGHYIIDQESWDKAGEILSEGTINPKITSKRMYSSKELCLEESFYYDGSNITLSIVKEGIVEFRCHSSNRDCQSTDIYGYYYSSNTFYRSPFRSGERRKRLCLHKVIAIRAMVEYIDKNNPGDSTNSEAEKLVEFIVKNRKIYTPQEVKLETSTVIDTEPVDIIPFFDYMTENLTFEIGRQRKYKVRKLDELLDGYIKKSTLVFGKNLTVDFATATLTDRAMSVLNFLNIARLNYYNRSGELRVSFPEENALLFFNLCSKISVLTPRGERYRAESEMARVRANFSFENKKNRKEITVVIKYPEAIKYSNDYFSFEGDRVIKYDFSSLGPLEKFMPNSSPYEVKFVFGNNNISVFYDTVLPMLEKVIDVNTALLPDYKEWQNEKRNYHFLMDYEGDKVSCRVNVLQGENIVDSLQENMKSSLHSEDEWVIKQVKVFFPLYNQIKNEWYFEDNEEDWLYNLVNEGFPVFLNMGEVSISDSLKNISIKRPSLIIFNASLTDNLLNLEIESKDIPKKELMKILESYRRKKRYHRLKNGDFLLLDDSLSGVEEVIKGMDFTQKELSSEIIQLPKYRALYLDSLMEKRDGLFTLERDQSFRRLIKDFKGFDASSYDIPCSLDSIMRPYQKDGFRWLSTLKEYGMGGILADEMGLGKTLQVISLILSMKEKGEIGSCLVVSPASLIYNWESELKKFAPNLKSVVCAGSPNERKKILCSLSGVDVLITSYDLLKRDIDTYRIRDFVLFVIDEAQFIKNINTEASKAVKLVHAKYRFALTGTPIENRLSELWSIFDFLMPGFLYSHEKFRTEIELPCMKQPDSGALERLRKMTGPFILRRLKSDVLKDLPEKLEEISYSEMESDQRRLYDAEVLRVRKNIEDEEESEFRKNKVQVLSELTRIREICCDPSLVYENYNGKSAKLDSLMDLIERALDEGHRILLFSQFTSMLELIEKRMDGQIPYFKITGSTPKEERLRLVDRFNSDTSIPLFLISLKAGGTGLNLTGADVVIHYDPWWNVAVQNQATDRAHRIGQTKVVTVYKMIAKNTIEDRIVEMQEAKKDLAEKILSGNETSLASLTKEELLEILS